MRFLVDVNVGRRIATLLAEEGYDVLWAGDIGEQTPDEQILQIGFREQRVVLTADRDFENLAIRQHKPFYAILRVPSESYEDTRLRLLSFLSEYISRITRGDIVCVTSSGVRVRHGTRPGNSD